MAKLLIHFNFISVLNDSGIRNVEWANQEIEDLKNEFRGLWGEYRKIIEKSDAIFKKTVEESKERRRNYGKVDIAHKEIQQLIESEELRVKELSQNIGRYNDGFDPQRSELDDIYSQTNNLNYEIKKIK